MQSSDLVSSFGEIARSKDIDRDALQLVVEDVFRAMIRKRYGSDEAFEIIFNPSQGDIQILHIRIVVDDWDLEDPVTEIELSEAKDYDEDFEVGDEVATEVDVSNFGRRAVMTARQTFRQCIRDIEKEQIYEQYSELIGEVVVGEIYQVRHRHVLVMQDDVELLLPRDEQIPHEHYRKGDMLRSIVKEVKRDAGSDPQVIISRTDNVFMERLFEMEVPEIYEGLVEIKAIARIPGDRAKVAVVSHDDRVDPVGACVGVKGVRIHAVVRELNNENIDVLLWSDNKRELISNALSPANPTDVRINEDESNPRARVEVPADEVSQAIGRGGVNIRLASQLTEFEIDVYRDIPADEEDIDIDEFGDELTPETIDKLKTIGCDTGKAVLELSADELSRRSGLDKSTAERVLEIIRFEFEEGPVEEGFSLEQPFTLESLDTDPPDVEEDEEDLTEEEYGEEVYDDEDAARDDMSPAEELTRDQMSVPAAEEDAVETVDAEPQDESLPADEEPLPADSEASVPEGPADPVEQAESLTTEAPSSTPEKTKSTDDDYTEAEPSENKA